MRTRLNVTVIRVLPVLLIYKNITSSLISNFRALISVNFAAKALVTLVRF